MSCEEASIAEPRRMNGPAPEGRALVFRFDESELKWYLESSDSLAVSVCFRREKQVTQLVVGEREFLVADVSQCTRIGKDFLALVIQGIGHLGLRFMEGTVVRDSLSGWLQAAKKDVERFGCYDADAVQSYFQYYGKLANQQNMLHDQVRTSTYREAIVGNENDFKGASVMDVGAGSGILTFFAAQAGAETLYAVEASAMADVVADLALVNQAKFPRAKIVVINKTLETITDEVEGKVDVLISEPIGTMLFNERMIESYLYARDRFLKPGGKMFPDGADLCIAPFSDPILYWEQQNKHVFWNNPAFYGLDLRGAQNRVKKEQFRQPIVDYINPEVLMAKEQRFHWDFTTVSAESLRHIEMPFRFEISKACLIHGIAGWFDAEFNGSDKRVVLSTQPGLPGTHWYQIRFMLQAPVAVSAGQQIEGVVEMKANNIQSYNVKIRVGIVGTNIVSECEEIDLKDPEYRCFTSQYAGFDTSQFNAKHQHQSVPQQPQPGQPQLMQYAEHPQQQWQQPWYGQQSLGFAQSPDASSNNFNAWHYVQQSQQPARSPYQQQPQNGLPGMWPQQVPAYSAAAQQWESYTHSLHSLNMLTPGLPNMQAQMQPSYQPSAWPYVPNGQLTENGTQKLQGEGSRGKKNLKTKKNRA